MWRRWLRAEVGASDESRLVRRPAADRDGERLRLQLFNGDTGVVVGRGRSSRGRLRAGRRDHPGSPTRLASVDTVYAMTIHKSQGSQFDTVAVLLPGPTRRS